MGGPRWCEDLYGDLVDRISGPIPPPDADVAVLCKPAFRAAWQARGVRRRVGWPTDHRRLLLTDVVKQPDGHRADAYAALGRAVGERVDGLPSLPCSPGPGDGAGVALLPFSASGATVDWQGYRHLADALAEKGVRVCFVGGPGDEDRLAGLAGPHRVVPTLGVAQVAALLAGADAVVGNDSGLTHLAAAARRGAGRRVDAVVGIAGSTSPARTGAPGARWLQAPAPDCAPCYRKTCGVGLGCLELPVSDVLHTVFDVLS